MGTEKQNDHSQRSETPPYHHTALYLSYFRAKLRWLFCVYIYFTQSDTLFMYFRSKLLLKIYTKLHEVLYIYMHGVLTKSIHRFLKKIFSEIVYYIYFYLNAINISQFLASRGVHDLSSLVCYDVQ